MREEIQQLFQYPIETRALNSVENVSELLNWEWSIKVINDARRTIPSKPCITGAYWSMMREKHGARMDEDHGIETCQQ